MDELTIKALLELSINPISVGGKKILPIPYEAVLRGTIGIHLNNDNIAPKPEQVNPKTELDLSPTITVEDEIMIPTEIMKLYPSEILKETMVEDVTNYLKEVAKCWEYRNLGFAPSLLKKAARARPALNGKIFTAYGKDGDEILSGLVKTNMEFIKKCWNDYSPLAED